MCCCCVCCLCFLCAHAVLAMCAHELQTNPFTVDAKAAFKASWHALEEEETSQADHSIKPVAPTELVTAQIKPAVLVSECPC